jgi:hypothetical protein
MVVEHIPDGTHVWHSDHSVRYHTENGRIQSGLSSPLDLIEPWVEKKKHDVWVNIYDEFALMHPTREQADRKRGTNCIACINIKFTEGDGL